MSELNDSQDRKRAKTESVPDSSSDYYFDSYSRYGIHEEMLKDTVRTQSYMDAIENNAHLFKDKIVLDVGCGTGILSMFAARAGAKKVFAIDCSNIAVQAKKIVEQNGFSSVVEVIQGKMEDIELPVKEVDIIVSEWMGYFLLYESMLDSVLYARDKYLVKTNGIILPDRAVLYVCGIEDATYRRQKVDFWSNVYGFDMSCIKEMVIQEPLVDIVDNQAVVSNARPILSINLLTCTKQDLAFSADFKLKFTRNDYLHALVGFFECGFTQAHKQIILSTSPMTTPTHWKQTVFYVQKPLTVCEGETMNGHITCAPNARNNRDLDISITYSFEGDHISSLLTDEERQLMDDYLHHEQFLLILEEAIKRNDTEELHATLHETKLNLNFFSLDGLTPLHIVCKLGHNEILQLLLQRGAQCNVVDKRHGHSPLQVAAMNGHSTCVATLLQNNANLCHVNTETTGKTALHFACENGNLMCIKELLNSRELNIVKKAEIIKVIQRTLNMQDNNGHTPLHLAVIDGNLACVKLLLEAGTNANLVNSEGKTALALARLMSNEQIAALLQTYTSELQPSTPQPAQQLQQHPYAALQSPSINASGAGVGSESGPTSFSEAVEAEVAGSGLFEGCSVVYENSSSTGSSSAASSLKLHSRYVIISGENLVEEEGSGGKVVVCSNRGLAEIVAEKFSKQLTEVGLRHGHTNVLKSDMMGNTMNNNSNIFSNGVGGGLGEWGRRKSLETRSSSSEDIGKNYQRWAVSGVHQSVMGISGFNGISNSSSSNDGGSPSARAKKCVVAEVAMLQLVTLSDYVLYETEASLLYTDSPKHYGQNGSSPAANGDAKFISQQLEAEDPMWEQFKRRHSKGVVVVTADT